MKFLNLSYLNEISNGDEDFIKTMLSLFLSETLPEVKSLTALAVAQNWSEVRRIAHRIKGPVNMVAANEVERVKSIEDMAATQKGLDKITDEIDLLEKFIVEQLVPEIEAYLS